MTQVTGVWSISMVAAVVLMVASIAVSAQQPSDAIYWCNVSRAQISQERDAALAQIETLKIHVKELEDKATKPTEAPKAK
jgi:hypothetical protein